MFHGIQLLIIDMGSCSGIFDRTGLSIDAPMMAFLC